MINESLAAYIEAHTTPESDTLRKLNRHTHAYILKPRMLSGHLQGRLLSMFSHMTRPKAILEIGTFTGYSAICLAEGLQAGGKVYTIDMNEELEEMVRSYIAEAGLQQKIEYIIGNALDVIPSMNTTFDVVFIDADKINYSRYYNMVFEKVCKGGYIIADNVLWSGKVVADTNKKIDADTQAILDYNRMIQEDTRVENILLPVRDGLLIARKL
jgi:predicted O-methyltransferase YrrM